MAYEIPRPRVRSDALPAVALLFPMRRMPKILASLGTESGALRLCCVLLESHCEEAKLDGDACNLAISDSMIKSI